MEQTESKEQSYAIPSTDTSPNTPPSSSSSVISNEFGMQESITITNKTNAVMVNTSISADQLSEAAKKRGHIIKEILETEQIYYDDVSRFLRYFLSSFRSQDKPVKKLFMNKPDLVSLCANLEQIASVSQQLIEELKEAIRKVLPQYYKRYGKNFKQSDAEITLWCSARCGIAHVFQRFTSMLQLYAHYASNFALSQTDVRIFMKDQSFLDVWEECAQAASAMVSPIYDNQINGNGNNSNSNNNIRESSSFSTLPQINKTKSKRESYVFTISPEIDSADRFGNALSQIRDESEREEEEHGNGTANTPSTPQRSHHQHNNSLGSLGVSRSDSNLHAAAAMSTSSSSLSASSTTLGYDGDNKTQSQARPTYIAGSSKSLVEQRVKRGSETRVVGAEKRMPGAYTRLDGFLILPIQRLPRYELLLKEVIKASSAGAPPDSSDFLDWEEEMKLLKDCLVEIEASNAHMNDAIKFSEKKQTLRELQKQFVPGTIIDLIGDLSDGNPRTLVSEGELVKIGRSGHKTYYFHLLTDAIMYSHETPRGLEFHRALMLDSQSSVEDAPAPTSNSYLTYINQQNRSTGVVKRSSLTIQAGTVRDLIKLFSGGKVSSPNRFSSNKKYLIKDDPNANAAAAASKEGIKSTAFRIITRKKTFIVYAASYHIKAVWMKHIRNVIQQLREKRSLARTRSFFGQPYSRGAFGAFKSHPKTPTNSQDAAGGATAATNEVDSAERRKSEIASKLEANQESRGTGHLKPLTDTEMQLYTSCKLCGSAFGIFRKRFQCRRCGLVICSGCASKTRVLDDYEPEKVCFVCCWEMDSLLPTDFPESMRLSAQVKQAKTGKNIEILVGGDKRDVVKKAYFSVTTATPTKAVVQNNSKLAPVSNIVFRGPSSVGVLDKQEGAFVVPLSVDISSYGLADEPYILVQMWVVDIGEIGSVRVPLIEVVRQAKLRRVGGEPVTEWYELRLRPAVAAQLGVASAAGSRISRARSRSTGARSRSQSASSRPRSNTASSKTGTPGNANGTANPVDPTDNDEQKIYLQLSFFLLPPPNLYNIPKVEKSRTHRLSQLDVSDNAAQGGFPNWSDAITWKRFQLWKSASESLFPYSLIAPSFIGLSGKLASSSSSSLPQVSSPKLPPKANGSPLVTSTKSIIASNKPDPALLKEYEEICESNPNVWSVILTNILYAWAMDESLFQKDEDRLLALSNKLSSFHAKSEIHPLVSMIQSSNDRRASLTGSILTATAHSHTGPRLKTYESDGSVSRSSVQGPRLKTYSSQTQGSNRRLFEILPTDTPFSSMFSQLLESESEYLDSLDVLYESFALPILELTGALSVAPSSLRSSSTSTSSQAIRVKKQGTTRFALLSRSEIDEREVKQALSQMDVSLLLNSIQQLRSMHEKFFGDLQKIAISSVNSANVEGVLRGFFSLLKVYYIYASSFCSVKMILLGTQSEIEGSDPKAYESILSEWLVKGAGYSSPVDASKTVLYFVDDLLASGMTLGGATALTTTTQDDSSANTGFDGSSNGSTSNGSSIVPNISPTAKEGIRRLIESCESDERCRGRGLAHYLSAPLQRVSDYKRILQSLSDSSPAPSSFDRVSKNLDETLSYLTKAIISRPNLEYLSTISSSLVSMPETVRLVNVHRWLIREGYLVKRCRYEDKVFKFWLFCDCIIYGKKTGKSNRYNFNRVIWLRDAAIRDLGEEGTTARGNGEQPGDCKNAFELISMNKSFVCMIPGNVEYSGSRVGVGGFGISSTLMPFGQDALKPETKWTQVERARTRIEWVSDISKCIEMDASRGRGETVCWAGDIPLLSSELDENEYFIESQRQEALESANANQNIIVTPSKDMATASSTPASNGQTSGDLSIKVKRRLSRRYTQDERIEMAAPVLEPNGTATDCHICSKPFSLILASYNCRNCGKLVCAKCSKEKRLLEHIDKSTPLRVCDNCVKTIDASQ